MKIVIMSVYPPANQPSGGVYSVTRVLTQALSKYNDIDVHVVSFDKDCNKTKIEQDVDVTVHRLPCSNWPQILDIFGPGKKRLLNYIYSLKPDIIHTHGSYGLTLCNISIPSVFTLHGFDFANLVADSAKHAWVRSRLWRYVERRSIASQKDIISITPYVRKMIESLTKARIYDIDNPVDERFFEIKRKPEHGRILCVGWINERKNTLGSVQAFAKIAMSFPQAKLVIAGHANETEYLNRVQKVIKTNGIDNQVEMLGYINRMQLEEELTKASVLLLPSRQENAPMAISEAMAARIPIITSNLCGMPYMVEEGQSGFLIDPESTEQISERLSQLVGSEQLCQQMGDKGHEIALERFHPNVVAKKTREVYEQICSENK